MINRLLGFGPAQFFKGLRQGDIPVMVTGAILLALRMRRRQRTPKSIEFSMKPGESVALRITRGDGEPVAYRIDA
jgi:hypothetical protein